MKNQKTYKPEMANMSQMWLDIIIPFVNDYNVKLNSRVISDRTNIPRRTVSRILNNLASKNIIRYKIEGKNKKYSLDLKDLRTRLLINFVENYKSFKFSLDFLDLFVVLEEIIKLNGLVLFGSYVRGDYTKESDVDILIIGKDSKKIRDLIRNFNKKINIHFSSLEDFSKLLKNKNTLALEIVENHIIFNCHGFIDLCWGFYNNEL